MTGPARIPSGPLSDGATRHHRPQGARAVAHIPSGGDRHSRHRTARFVWLYLSLIAALTFPHLLIVALMDLRQGMLPMLQPRRG